MTIHDLISALNTTWDKNAPASLADVEEVESVMHLMFPDDYKVVLHWSDGGEGPIGTEYLSLWAVDELHTLNQNYEIQARLPGFFGIGTDGGGICFGFDLRESINCFCSVPLGDLEWESLVPLGRFATVLSKWISGEALGNQRHE